MADMIIKYTLSVEGDNFYPSKIAGIDYLNLVKESSFDPTDKKFLNRDDCYNYGDLTLSNKRTFAISDEAMDYQEDFVIFLEKNFSFFISKGAENFTLYLDIFYCGHQCNYYLLTESLMSRISSLNIRISYPISVYKYTIKNMKKFTREIELNPTM